MQSEHDYSAVRAKQALASRLRNECKYEESIAFYFEAQELLKEKPKDIFGYELGFELSCDIGLALFEQGSFDESSFIYERVRKEIDRDYSHRTDLLFKASLMLGIIYLGSDRIWLAEECSLWLQCHLSLIVEEEYQGQYASFVGNLASKKNDWCSAEAAYSDACRNFSAALKINSSHGSYRRYAAALFNLSRVKDKLDKNEAAISFGEQALKIHRKYFGKDHPISCRYHLELARLYEKLSLTENNIENLQKSIDHLRKVYEVNSQILIAEPNIFHRFDLVEHHALLKRLAFLHVKLNNLLVAGQLYENEAAILAHHFPIEQLTCLELAAKYYSLSDDPVLVQRYASVLTKKSELLFSFSIPDHFGAITALREAYYCEPTEDRKSLLQAYENACQEFFQGWSTVSPPLVQQWFFCVEQFRNFQQHCLSDVMHSDDFFHWKEANLELSPQRRVQLMMILSRLHCLLDQSYNYFVKQYINRDSIKAQYFPWAASEEDLSTEWVNKGVNWDSFSSVRDALVKVQPFSRRDPRYLRRTSWLFPLMTIANYAKHVHLGIQVLSKTPLQSRKGLLRRRFQGIELGVTRMSSNVYPFSFTEILDSADISQTIFDCFCASGLLVVDPKAHSVSSIAEVDPVAAYLASEDESTARAAHAEYEKKIRELTLARLPQLTPRDIFSVASFLLNLAAQSKGLSETTQRIPISDFIDATFEGVAFLLQTFGRASPIVSPPITIDDFTDPFYLNRLPLSKLVECFTQFKESPKGCSLSEYDRIARQLIDSYLLTNCKNGIDDILRHTKQYGPAWLYNKYSVMSVEYSAPMQSADVDHDLLARLDFVRKSIKDFAYSLFRANAYHRMLFKNMAAGVYLQLHFVLDQIFQRYCSRLLCAIYQENYPQNNADLNEVIQTFQFKGKSISTELVRLIRKSFSWWTDFRITSLRIKHANLDNLNSFITQTGLSKGVLTQLNLIFQNSLEEVTEIVIAFSNELNKLTDTPRIYEHFKYMPGFLCAPAEKDFSHAIAVGSAAQSQSVLPMISSSSSFGFFQPADDSSKHLSAQECKK